MYASSERQSEHTPLRQTEKHFKSRALLPFLPSLSSAPTPFPVHDLSRPGPSRRIARYDVQANEGEGSRGLLSSGGRSTREPSDCYSDGDGDGDGGMNDAKVDEVYESGWWSSTHESARRIALESGEVHGKRGGKRGEERDHGVGGKRWRELVGVLNGRMTGERDRGVRGGYGVEDVWDEGDEGDDGVRSDGFGDGKGKWGGASRVRLHGGKEGFVVAEGCILIPHYLTPRTQLALARSALSDYTRPPNPLSLDTQYALPPDLFARSARGETELIDPRYGSLTVEERAAVERANGSGDHEHENEHDHGNEQQHEQEEERADKDSGVKAISRQSTTTSAGPASSSLSSSTSRVRPGGGGRRTIETPAEAVVDYAEVVRLNQLDKAKGRANGECTPSDKLKARSAGELMKELRWANLGLVYRWTTKSYDFTPDVPIPFPPDLATLCTGVVREIPWDEVFKGVQDPPVRYNQWVDDYEPDTGIVNFYQLNDTLMAHVDRAELDPSRPLVSFSLGHACIFLLGTASRNDPPIPIILRSGDVLIMAGKGRQAYHGVPRIMEGTLPRHFRYNEGGREGGVDESVTEEENVDIAVYEFMRTARININVRQVFPPDFERPC